MDKVFIKHIIRPLGFWLPAMVVLFPGQRILKESDFNWEINCKMEFVTLEANKLVGF